MNISSLSIQNKRRLSKLLEELTDLLSEKDLLIENASKEVDKMDEALDMQSKLDEKGTEFTNIATSIEAKELQDLVIKSDKLSSEIENINYKSRELNDQLEELSERQNTLMSQINDILLKTDTNAIDLNKGIYVDSLSTSVFIVDAQIPEDIDVISKENCEIINCNINLISEISDLYNSNINKIITEADNNDFIELKEKVQKYKEDKNNSYDKQLEMLKKSFETEPVVEEAITPSQEIPNEEKQETVISEETQEKPILDNVSETDSIDKLLSLQTVMDNPTEEKIQVDSLETLQNISNETPIEESKVEEVNKNVVYINSEDKVVPNQIARATKDKLNNKIMKIFEGSYPETKIEYIPALNNNATFNLENFINNKAA